MKGSRRTQTPPTTSQNSFVTKLVHCGPVRVERTSPTATSIIVCGGEMPITLSGATRVAADDTRVPALSDAGISSLMASMATFLATTVVALLGTIGGALCLVCALPLMSYLLLFARKRLAIRLWASFSWTFRCGPQPPQQQSRWQRRQALLRTWGRRSLLQRRPRRRPTRAFTAAYAVHVRAIEEELASEEKAARRTEQVHTIIALLLASVNAACSLLSGLCSTHHRAASAMRARCGMASGSSSSTPTTAAGPVALLAFFLLHCAGDIFLLLDIALTLAQLHACALCAALTLGVGWLTGEKKETMKQ